VRVELPDSVVAVIERWRMAGETPEEFIAAACRQRAMEEWLRLERAMCDEAAVRSASVSENDE
jgi:hypothetical protein